MFDVKHRDADKTRSCYVFGGLDGLQNYARGQVGCVSVKQVYPLDSLIEFTGGSVGGVHDRVMYYGQKMVVILYISVSYEWLKVMGWLGGVLDFFPDFVPTFRLSSRCPGDGRTSLARLLITYGCQQQ